MRPKSDQRMIGIRGWVEVCVIIFLFLPHVSLAAVDSDADGLNDNQEFLYGTQILETDTDKDGFSDSEEVKNGFSPILPGGKTLGQIDSDKDKLLDWQEYWFGTNVQEVDTDGDTFSDYEEVIAGFSPTEVTTSTVFSRTLLVDLTKQQLYYLVHDMRIRMMPVSTGNPGTPTPPGEFAVQRKIPVMRYTGPGYDLKGVKWNMEFLPHYYLHTAYWHNDFGKRTHSHGCVNLREADAAFLYKYVPVGMTVQVIGTTPKKFRVGT